MIRRPDGISGSAVRAMPSPLLPPFQDRAGIRRNLSKSGVSTSVGRKRAWLTFGSRGTRSTVGVPGTGVAYSETSRSSRFGVVVVILLGVLLFWLIL